ncbi:leishmanolysin family protein, putative [Ichthyophthirius multifiliis]|uniref:Leishmanolysin family protein, putative n=1 Tax=Ichthyophthirius multifiliis TaxID=5932 RepID=G0R6N1_ICHMU|nr:leishmanolysin family protein, putative [Ichthyophthirius multifiliis]EGR26870.1 leishmanolysin family protein, putative [Ichthyophthirius multifiliis]|eukprot:XP_004023754.1 leishmanolysin family protein, putative [Ichthyophthirius multifiliis]
MRIKNTKCGIVTIPQKDKSKGQNSDLHLYISYKIENDKEYLAYALQCQHVAGIGPTHGSINFNLDKMPKFEQNAFIEFEDLMEVVIHEITHVLGFSDHDMSKWILPKGTTHAFVTTKIKEVNTVLLKTPNVLKFAREYFGCSILEGMPLQHLGGEDSVKFSLAKHNYPKRIYEYIYIIYLGPFQWFYNESSKRHRLLC